MNNTVRTFNNREVKTIQKILRPYGFHFFPNAPTCGGHIDTKEDGTKVLHIGFECGCVNIQNGYVDLGKKLKDAFKVDEVYTGGYPLYTSATIF